MTVTLPPDTHAFIVRHVAEALAADWRKRHAPPACRHALPDLNAVEAAWLCAALEQPSTWCSSCRMKLTSEQLTRDQAYGRSDHEQD
jgi:hypothetical protein